MGMTAAPLNRELIQRRTVLILAIGQVVGAFGTGAGFSMGSLMAAQLSGNPAFAGFAATASMLGAAVVSIPLARAASRWGRRPALTIGMCIAGAGSLIIVLAAVLLVFPLFLVGMFMLGSGSATNYQTRFAAADLASDRTRARDLSLVIWATTIGVVIGPNLATPGDALGHLLGLPALAGAFLIPTFAYIVGITFFNIGLRPDPLLVARSLETAEQRAIPTPKGGFRSALRILSANPVAAATVAVLALSNGVMVGVMGVTPVHLAMMDITLPLIGITVSMHTAGMYALSPIFGWLSDRFGRVTVIVAGEIVYGIALIINAVAAHNMAAVMVALTLLGIAWSMTTVAGSALLTESVDINQRTTVQGFSDSMMSYMGAVGAILAGLLLGGFGYGLLNVVTMASVVLSTGVILLVRRRPKAATL